MTLGPHLARWDLVPDGEPITTPSSLLLAVRHNGVPAMLKIAREEEERRGGALMAYVSPHLLRRQMTLIASWTFSTVIQAECAAFCVERKVDVDRLFTHRWTLDQADEAYKLFDKQADGKGVFLI